VIIANRQLEDAEKVMEAYHKAGELEKVSKLLVLISSIVD
jgi:hypothetical protein